MGRFVPAAVLLEIMWPALNLMTVTGWEELALLLLPLLLVSRCHRVQSGGLDLQRPGLCCVLAALPSESVGEESTAGPRGRGAGCPQSCRRGRPVAT